MKKMIIMAALFVIAISANAQHGFGHRNYGRNAYFGRPMYREHAYYAPQYSAPLPIFGMAGSLLFNRPLFARRHERNFGRRRW